MAHLAAEQKGAPRALYSGWSVRTAALGVVRCGPVRTGSASDLRSVPRRRWRGVHAQASGSSLSYPTFVRGWPRSPTRASCKMGTLADQTLDY